MFTAAYLLLLTASTAQYPNYTPGYGYGYNYPYYSRTPLPMLDPMRYSRFYSGEGYYQTAPPVIANPEVFNLNKPSATSQPGVTGVVVALNEQAHQITLQLPASKVTVPYGPSTHFLANDGHFPVIKPGNVINVNQNTITIVSRNP